jgi:hypothetical protein
MNNENSSVAVETVVVGGAEIGDSGAYETAEVTAMNNETTTQAAETTTQATEAKPAKAKKAKKEPRNYPFLTKAQILDRIQNDFSFACQVICILHDRQTEWEQENKATLDRNRRGFMSSHAVHGSRIAVALKNGEILSPEDQVRVDEMAPRYTKQMAGHFREEAIKADPTLAEKAACFFTEQ